MRERRFFIAMLFSGVMLAGAACADTPESPTLTALRADAERGDVKAQNIMADAYFHGTGVQKNPQEALRWLRKAADLGDGRAFSLLGTMYYQGIGVPKDSNEAVRWWTKGAEKYDTDAQSQLAYAYLLGDAVPRNFTMAYMWFNIAASNGDANAVKGRDSVSQSLNAEMVAEAQRLGQEWMQEHAKPVVAAPVVAKPAAVVAPH